MLPVERTARGYVLTLLSTESRCIRGFRIFSYPHSFLGSHGLFPPTLRLRARRRV